MNDEHKAFARALVERLERSCDELDAPTRTRLRTIRQRASAIAADDRRRWLGAWQFGAFAVAATLLLALALWPRTPPEQTEPTALVHEAADDATEQWLVEADADAFDEDLEFYLWLELLPQDS